MVIKGPIIQRLSKKIKKYLEDRFDCTEEEMDKWIAKRLHYLPGDIWPEKWLVQKNEGNIK